jgi:hypothetical protein
MEFKNDLVMCKVDFLKNCSGIRIIGTIPNRDIYKKVMLIAANPIDKMSSYSGTGLPYPCADIAFEGSKNNFEINASGNFNTEFSYPNSYYTVANKMKVVSSIFFILENMQGKKEFVRFELKDMYPLRTLTNRESRSGPQFYSDKYDILPIETAEAIMKEYAKIKVSHKIA